MSTPLFGGVPVEPHRRRCQNGRVCARVWLFGLSARMCVCVRVRVRVRVCVCVFGVWYVCFLVHPPQAHTTAASAYLSSLVLFNFPSR